MTCETCHSPQDTVSQQDTILVVDGNVIERTVISDYLRHCGYRVIEAHDASEAQQALNQEGFNVDVILSDLELPGETNGFQLASWVRTNMPGVKVVLSAAIERTANAVGDLCEEGPHLAKPYDPLMVLDHIKRLKGNSMVK
jgi:CheY-like chemotaxis protein